MASKQPDNDEYMRQYLRRMDLDHLDLSHIKLDEVAPPFHGIPWLRLLALLGCLGIAGLGATRSSGSPFQNTALLWVVVILMGLLIFSMRRWLAGGLIRWVPWLSSWEFFQLEGPLFRWPVLSARALRWMLLASALTLGSILLFFIPRDVLHQEGGSGSLWFLGMGIALVTGILLGRWLIMQAQATPPPQDQAYPSFKFPPWFKWVTLAMLVAGALFASLGHHMFAEDSGVVSFTLSGVGLVVGILGAMWLARRFDEVEAQLRARSRQRPPPDATSR